MEGDEDEKKAEDDQKDAVEETFQVTVFKQRGTTPDRRLKSVVRFTENRSSNLGCPERRPTESTVFASYRKSVDSNAAPRFSLRGRGLQNMAVRRSLAKMEM